ncbi:MAG: acetate--CoA ligase [Alphaproteobacteria bacterium]|nr:acetate--CoA ligase [Alphaproteobacteria bacterium]
MSTSDLIPVKPSIQKHALVSAADYQRMYNQSLEQPDVFWAEQARKLDWMKPFTRVKNTSFNKPVSIKWFEDGVMNVSVNCLDRHLEKRAHQTALLWESDDGHLTRHISYQQAYDETCKLANALKKLGVKKGDRVTIYMPMIPEAAFAMLACARIGAVHSVVFGGFSPTSLKERILDCGSEVVITADEGLRGSKTIPLKQNTDEALKGCPIVKHVVVVKRTGNSVSWNERDKWYHELIKGEAPVCAPEPVGSEDPLFILYTSGSTGKPKGVLHTCAGYLLYASLTHKWVFDVQEGEVYFCTADVGWVTGHSYVVYGPLANGTTSLMFEGVPNYPDASRFWQIVDKHKVNIFYTAPTAIRALMREGDDFVKQTSRASLRILATVGEPINPEAWMWYYRVVGDERCPIIDTWWQTETGGHAITPMPATIPLKPGSATLPFFGIKPVLVDNDGKELHGAAEGNLCLVDSWPGQARSLYGDHARFEQTYFTTYAGKYFTGDGARRDGDGYYWITGRVDDVLNVAGHRLGTAEIESALVAHTAVAEAAVVGFPHDIKGQGIYAFVTLKADQIPSDALNKELIGHVRKIISPIATPDFIQFTVGLPKTRSGKIMRRILRKIVCGETDQLGDTSTLADPNVVEDLLKNKRN